MHVLPLEYTPVLKLTYYPVRVCVSWYVVRIVLAVYNTRVTIVRRSNDDEYVPMYLRSIPLAYSYYHRCSCFFFFIIIVCIDIRRM